MRVFLTGGTGFVGGALAEALARGGAQLSALVRPGSNRDGLEKIGARLIEGDVTEPDSLRGKVEGFDAIVHAAGMLGQAGVPEARYHLLHVAGTRNLLQAALETSPPPRVLYVSSPGVLGPITGEPADEETPLAPSNPYERSKAAAEQVALSFAKRGLPVIVSRPEFIYGPRDQHVLGLFRAVASGRFFYIDGGRHTCHPTYVEDAVQGLLRCLAAGRAGEIYHIAGPRPVTFRELGETIAAEVDATPPRLSLPRPLAWVGAAVLEAFAVTTRQQPPLSRSGVAFFGEDRRFSWMKAHRELGYAPQFDLQAGVARTVAWYRAQGWL